MRQALNPEATIVIVDDTDKDPKMEFEVRVLPIKTRLKWYEIFQKERDVQGAHEDNRAYVKETLVQLKNVCDIKGQPLHINGQGATDEILDALSEVRMATYDNVIGWLATKTMKANIPSEQDSKNSVLQSNV